MSVKKILVGDIVNRNVFTISPCTTVNEAAIMLSEKQASDLMVVDENNQFIGVVSEGDLIRYIIPSFEELLSLEKTLGEAAKIFLEFAQDLINQPISRFVIYDAITLKPDDELLKSAVVMAQKNIRRLPVVQDKLFIGTISRADICRAILTGGNR